MSKKLTPKDKLVREFRKSGHLDMSEAIILVDFVMKEFAFTNDPLDEKAEELGKYLREWILSWPNEIIVQLIETINSKNDKKLKRNS